MKYNTCFPALVVYAIVGTTSASYSQSFEHISDILVPVSGGKIYWLDLDNDGDLDVLYSGTTNWPFESAIQVYENSNGTFVAKETGLPTLRNGSIAAGDFDNDGDFDILISGIINSENTTVLYENIGSLTFIPHDTFYPLFNSVVVWFDLDNDGDIDFLVAGSDDHIDHITLVYENTPTGFQLMETNLPPFAGCAVEPADINGDGKVDLLITGIQDDNGSYTYLFLNNGDGTFTRDDNSPLEHLYLSDVKAGDFDNDGDMDVLLSGVGEEYKVNTIVYENTGFHLRERSDIELQAVVENPLGGSAWVDYDNDGDLDIIVSGYESWTTFIPVFKLYRNDGHGAFFEVSEPVFQGMTNGSITYGDYDNDGDFDFAFIGDATPNIAIAGIYKNLINSNVSFSQNSKPLPPSNGFSTKKFRKQVLFQSGPGSDVETPTEALTYNFYLRNSLKRIISPASDFSTGTLLTTNPPNGQAGKILVNDIPEGELMWAVQTIDGGKVGSVFSDEQTFYHINGPEVESIRIIDPNNIELKWIDHSGIETNFKISRSTQPNSDFSEWVILPENSNSYTDHYPFQTDTYYYYRIAAIDREFESGYDSAYVVIPNPPTNLIANTLSSSSISLSWNDNSLYESGYLIERGFTSTDDFYVLDTLTAGTETFVDYSLEEATMYVYRVKALNQFGASDYANEASAKTLVNSPEAEAIRIIDSNNITLTWIDHSAKETNFKITRSTLPHSDFSLLVILPENTSSYTDNDVFQTDTYYYYRIMAMDGSIESDYDSLYVVIPSPPSDLNAISVNSSTISVSWKDNSQYETGYVIERKLASANDFLAADTLAAGAETFIDYNLEEGTIYFYRIKAINEYGASDYTNEATAKTNSRPLAASFQLTTLEDNVLVITGIAEHFSDPDEDVFHSIVIVSVPDLSMGVLYLSNEIVGPGDTLFANQVSSLEFHPAKDVFGETNLTFYYNDGKDNASDLSNLDISITPVNDPPVISVIDDIEIEGEEISSVQVNFTVNDVDNELAALVLEATSDNQALVPDDGFTFTGDDEQRTLEMKIVGSTSGSARITISVSDGLESASTQFNTTFIIITGVDDRLEPKIDVYPNPFESTVIITMNDLLLPVVLYLADGVGTKVAEHLVTKPSIELDLSQLSSGLYIIQFTNRLHLKSFKILKK